MIDYIIIAISGRALAVSANRAGYRVIVADCFADEDTSSVSEAVYQLQYTDDGFIEEELLTTIEKILSPASNAKLVIGSGFESQPDLIDKLAELAPVFSNNKKTIIKVKEPSSFFPMLKKYAISHPKTMFSRPDLSENYLIKKNAGIGGINTRWLEQNDESDDNNYYYQEYVPGEVASVLFLANGKQAKIVGFNHQLQSEDFPESPFLYQGAITLNKNIINNIEVIDNIINKITSSSKLKGLCGLDYIINEQNEVVVLEVNPRPPATFELHEEERALFDAHLACFDGKFVELEQQNTNNSKFKGYAILYAKENLFISDKLMLPEWVKDRPRAESVIPTKFPVCSVHAKEISLDKLKAMLFNRLLQIETMIAATKDAA
jgi:predicted ATP-grasp superfamily ATP-dependent carboligase